MSWIIAGLALVFAIISFFVARRKAKVFFKVEELADFGLPDEFYATVNKLPLVLRIVNRGNKQARNIVLRICTTAPLQDISIVASVSPDLRQDGEKLTVNFPLLNPKDDICLRAFCPNDPGDSGPARKLIRKLVVTAADGDVVDRAAPDETMQVMRSIAEGLGKAGKDLYQLALIGALLLFAFFIGIAIAPHVIPDWQQKLNALAPAVDTLEALPDSIPAESVPSGTSGD